MNKETKSAKSFRPRFLRGEGKRLGRLSEGGTRVTSPDSGLGNTKETGEAKPSLVIAPFLLHYLPFRLLCLGLADQTNLDTLPVFFIIIEE